MWFHSEQKKVEHPECSLCALNDNASFYINYKGTSKRVLTFLYFRFLYFPFFSWKYTNLTHLVCLDNFDVYIVLFFEIKISCLLSFPFLQALLCVTTHFFTNSRLLTSFYLVAIAYIHFPVKLLCLYDTGLTTFSWITKLWR